MKKLVLVCMVVLVVAALTAPTAQALPICFKWVFFCDGIQVNARGLGGGEWYHWDCVNNSPMDVSGARFLDDNCAGSAVFGYGIRSVAPNGPGDYYFIADSPLDGTLDFLQGVYPFGTCLGSLDYNLLMGPCVGVAPGGERGQVPNVSSVQ